MLVLVGILAVSAFVVGYLIWSDGGFVAQPEPVEIVHTIPGFSLRLPQVADVPAFLSIAGEPEAMKHHGWDTAMLASFGHEQRSLTLDALQKSTMVAEADSGEVAGFTWWGSRAGDPNQISIGLHVGQIYAGQGVGTGLLRAAILARARRRTRGVGPRSNDKSCSAKDHGTIGLLARSRHRASPSTERRNVRLALVQGRAGRTAAPVDTPPPGYVRTERARPERAPDANRGEVPLRRGPTSVIVGLMDIERQVQDLTERVAILEAALRTRASVAPHLAPPPPPPWRSPDWRAAPIFLCTTRTTDWTTNWAPGLRSLGEPI